MVQPEEKKQEQSDIHYNQALRQALGKLSSHSQDTLKKKYGLSEQFKMEAPSEESALSMCEKAMDSLSTQYVSYLDAFLNTEDPQASLTALNDAEGVWKEESSIISAFDQEGGEKEFLLRMRGQFYQVMENKLEEASRRCHKRATDENIALCIGILAMMDQVLHEFGHGLSDPERKRVRDLAAKFK